MPASFEKLVDARRGRISPRREASRYVNKCPGVRNPDEGWNALKTATFRESPSLQRQSFTAFRDSLAAAQPLMASQTMHSLETAFSQAWPAREWCDSHTVLAVSGGADSVAMLRAAVAIQQRWGGNGRLFVAHLDHGLRGVASVADADWLKIVCQRLEVPFEFSKADVAAIAQSQGDGLEAAARTARYDFLQQTAEKLGARFVAVAHTADDQIETVLHRILRGTGIDGLRGIPAVRPLSGSVSLVRPLLAVRRRDVLNYLSVVGQDYRTDASNSDLRWTRNRLRHALLPAIREHFPGDVDSAVLRLSGQAVETQQYLAVIAAQLTNDCVTLEFAPPQAAGPKQVCRIRISGDKLSAQPPLIIREVCKAAWQEAAWPRQAMGYDQWRLLASVIGGDNNNLRINLPGDVRAWREGRDLLLERGTLP